MAASRTKRESVPPAKQRGGTRSRAKEETRLALINAGIAAFADEGLDAPSLDAICERAGYTRGAFYVHFQDRDDFLVATMEHILQMYFDAVIATGDAALDLKRTVDTFIAAADAESLPLQNVVRSHQFFAACARSEQIRDRFVAMLDDALRRVTEAALEGQEAGTVRADVPAKDIATILVLIANGMHSLMEIDAPLDLVEASRDINKLLWTKRGAAED